AQLTEARASGERMLAMQNELDTLDRQIEQNNVALSYKQRDVKRIVEPVQPTIDDIRLGEPVRQAWMYATGSSVAIFLFFGSWILLTLHGAARENQYSYAAVAASPRAENAPGAAPKSTNGPQEEESAPA